MQDRKTHEMRAFWASPGWLGLWADLMSGLRHDLTGRVSALHSLSIVASRGLAKIDMLTEELARESGQLSTLAHLLESFPGPAGRRDVGVSLSHVISPLPSLLELVTDLSGADVTLDLPLTLPAVVIDPGPARAVLLVCMADAVTHSPTASCSVAAARLGGTLAAEPGDSREVAISISPSDGTTNGEPTKWLCDETWSGIAGVVATWGGTATTEGSARVLTAPTL